MSFNLAVKVFEFCAELCSEFVIRVFRNLQSDFESMKQQKFLEPGEFFCTCAINRWENTLHARGDRTLHESFNI